VRQRLGMLLFAAALCTAAFSQVVMEEIGTLQESFATARQAAGNFQFPQAMAALDPLIATLTRWEKAGRLQPTDEALLEQALELRGLCAYNLGKVDQAKQDFTRLIQLRPEYPFSQSRTPKIQRLFEEIRASLTGTVTLSVLPEDAQVAVDGRSIGSGSNRALPMLRGLHVIRATRPGYDSVEREVNVDVGSSLPLDLRLTPNARTLYFFVTPQGTDLLLDGKPAGRAEKPASAQPDWVRFLQEGGASTDGLWAIPALYLPPGEHRVTLIAPCHKSREFLLDVVLDKVNNAPGYIKPIRLERKTVQLAVTSHPSGSEVIVDGESLGVTPLTRPDFCIGRHDFLLKKAGIGEYRSTITVTDTSPFRVDAALRPTLLWVGLTRDQEVTDSQLQAASSAIQQGLIRLERFNESTAQEKNPLLPDTFFAPGVGEEERAQTAKELCDKYACQGLLAGKLSMTEGGLETALRLFVPGLPGFDEFVRQTSSAEQSSLLLASLDAPLFTLTPDRLPVLLDLPGAPGPVFLRGLGRDGPLPGDLLVAVNGTPSPTAAAARTLLSGSEAPLLKLQRKGQERTWTLRREDLYYVAGFGGVSFDYRRQWLVARQAFLGAESPDERFYSAANLACADLNLGRASETLRDLEGVEPPPSGSFSSASLSYLKAVALLRLDRVEEARPLLLTAAADPSASLDGQGKILVQPLARDALRQMPPPPPVSPVPPGGPGRPAGR
jgi:hypothetical protein